MEGLVVVRTCLSRGRQDRRQVEELPEAGMGQDILPKLVWRKVPHELEQPHLVVDDEEHLVSRPLALRGWASNAWHVTELFLSSRS